MPEASAAMTAGEGTEGREEGGAKRDGTWQFGSGRDEESRGVDGQHGDSNDSDEGEKPAGDGGRFWAAVEEAPEPKLELAERGGNETRPDGTEGAKTLGPVRQGKNRFCFRPDKIWSETFRYLSRFSPFFTMSTGHLLMASGK